MLQTFSRNEPPGKAPPSRGRSVEKKEKRMFEIEARKTFQNHVNLNVYRIFQFDTSAENPMSSKAILQAYRAFSLSFYLSCSSLFFSFRRRALQRLRLEIRMRKKRYYASLRSSCRVFQGCQHGLSTSRKLSNLSDIQNLEFQTFDCLPAFDLMFCCERST